MKSSLRKTYDNCVLNIDCKCKKCSPDTLIERITDLFLKKFPGGLFYHEPNVKTPIDHPAKDAVISFIRSELSSIKEAAYEEGLATKMSDMASNFTGEIRSKAFEEGKKAMKEEVLKVIPVIYCVPNKCADDGVHLSFRCPDCSQTWGEEMQTPICLDPVIRLHTLLSAIEKILTDKK